MSRQSRTETVLWNLVASGVWQLATSSGVGTIVTALVESYLTLPTPAVVGVGLIAGGLTWLGWQRLLTRHNDWSPYDFYRDAANDALRIGTRNARTPEDEFGVGVDHGVLLGRIGAILPQRGLAHEWDRLQPYGNNPRFVSGYANPNDPHDEVFRHRRMLQELRGRLIELRDEHAPKRSGR